MGKRACGQSVFLAVLIALAGTAEAADYAIQGLARDNRGGVELPLSTGGGFARGIAIHGTAMQSGSAVPGGGPATIRFPPGVASDDPTITGGFLVGVPQVIQLTTMFKHYGPTTTSTIMAGRAGPTDFALCPGAAANPNCTTVQAGGSQGTLNGIVKYTGGPNKFGGTFKVLLSGTGKLTSKGSVLPSTVMTPMGGTRPALPFSAINGALGANGAFVPAGGFSIGAMDTNIFLPSPATHPYSYRNTPMGLLERGPIVGAGFSEINSQTAFPMTTGAVYGYAQIGPGGYAPYKFTSTGYDNRTANGIGRIQLIGAALARNYPADGSNPPEGSVVNRMTVTVAFTPQPALPLNSPAVLVTIGSLVLLTAGYGFSCARSRA